MTVQATGIGGPSAAIVVGELAEMGLRAAIRVGTCASLGPNPPLGAGLVVGAAMACEGTSAALGAATGALVEPDSSLLRALGTALPGEPVTVVSRDLPLGRFPDPPEGAPESWVGDLQTAPLLLACSAARITAAAVLAVGICAGRRLDDEPLDAQLIRLAESGAEALESLNLS